MDLKIANRNNIYLNEFLDIPRERFIELSGHISNELMVFVDQVFGERPKEKSVENIVLANCIKHCKTIEEVVYVSVYFNEMIEKALELSIEQIIKQN